MTNIDKTDREIIKLLQTDGRMSYSDIANAVGLSRTAVTARISALENSGVIKGYRAVVGTDVLNDVVIFIMNVETEARDFEGAKQFLSRARETVTLIQTTGNCHLVAVCVADSIKTMRTFVNLVYKTLPGILSVNANPVIDTVKGSIIPDGIISEVYENEEGTDSNSAL